MKPLASFRKPPLHEVALMVQFEAVTELTSAHIGSFWQEVRGRLPHIQEQPPLPGVPIERAGSQSQLGQTFIIHDGDEFIGRLYTELSPIEIDGEAVIRYDLTARGRLKSPTVEGAMEFLDLGRRLIVECFERSTSADMHEIWGKE